MAFENDKTLNINIYKDNFKDIESSQNKSETYIILANEELNNKLREQLYHVSKLDEEISDLENDNERMEKVLHISEDYYIILMVLNVNKVKKLIVMKNIVVI